MFLRGSEVFIQKEPTTEASQFRRGPPALNTPQGCSPASSPVRQVNSSELPHSILSPSQFRLPMRFDTYKYEKTGVYLYNARALTDTMLKHHRVTT